jgi:hypothetical protein
MSTRERSNLHQRSTFKEADMKNRFRMVFDRSRGRKRSKMLISTSGLQVPSLTPIKFEQLQLRPKCKRTTLRKSATPDRLMISFSMCDVIKRPNLLFRPYTDNQRQL